MNKQGVPDISRKSLNLAAILLTHWNSNYPVPDHGDGASSVGIPMEGIEANRASRYLLPEYKSIVSPTQLLSRPKEQGGMRYDLIMDLFQTTDYNCVNAFTQTFTFGVEMNIWRKGKSKSCIVFLDQHIPTLLWITSPTKAFLFDITYTTFTRFDAQFEHSSPTQHYIILRYFQEEIPLLFQSQDEVQRYFNLFVNYRNYYKVKNQYPPYLSKLIKYYTLAQMNSDYKRTQTVAEIIKIASNISDDDREEEHLEIIKELIKTRQQPSNKQHQSKRIEEMVLCDSEVMEFMKIASCNQNLKAIFENYAHMPMQTKMEYTAPIMDLKQFKKFLIEEQHQPLSSIDPIISNLIQISNPYDTLQKYLSFYEFCSYCYRIDINYLVRQPQPNKNLPITDYFIWSSHNTYLSGNQLTSDAKVERYLEDLNDGIKCMEIDVHDSGNNLIVTHALKGLHLNRSVTFEEVISSIGFFCRKNEDFDPIILSIQNHASQQNRYTMVNIIFKYLKRYLFTLQDENLSFGGEVISQRSASHQKSQYSNQNQIGSLQFGFKCKTLAELKGKIIIKTDSKIESILNQKRRKPHKSSVWVNLDVDNRMKQPKYFPSTSFTERFKDYESLTKRMQGRKQKFIEEFPTNYYQNTGDQMARVTGMFKNHQGIYNTNPLCYQCISLTNKSLQKLQISESQNYTKKSFIRVYPVATEVGSANYNPIHGLQRGAQIIAINTQTKDDYAWLMMSYFTAGKKQDSKYIGYVQKPQYLKSKPKIDRAGSLSVEGVKKKIQLKKFQSATDGLMAHNSFQLVFHPSSKIDFSKRVELSILSKHQEVKVKFFGTDLDMERNRSNKYSFDIYDYNQAFFMFEIGQSLKDCVPVRFLREGYRVIAGRNANFNDCGVRILVKVKIKHIEN